MIASISMFMAVLLCIETVLSINVYAFQKDSSELEEKKFNLISNVISEDNITLYQYQDEYYISVEDLCDLTRCTYSVEDGVITLIQGFWGAEFDYGEQTFRDGEQIINTHIFKLSGKDNYAIPVLEYLLYFKSSIAYIKDDTLYCTMPEFTAWEALDIDYENTLIDIYELYGGEGYVTFSLTLDILMDFILGDMPANSDMYVKDAYDAALTVNLSKYEAVGQYIEENSSALNSFIDSDKAKDTFELLDGLVEHGSSGMEYFISSYYNLVANDFAETMIYAFDEGKIDTGFYCANNVLEAFEKEDLIKENTEKFADKTSEFLFWTSLAVESAMEIKQHADTDYLLYNVMGSKNVSSLGINVQDNSYFIIANQYKNESEITKNNAIEKYVEFLADQMRDEAENLIDPVVKKVTGLGTAIWSFSKDAAVFFAKKFPPTHATIEAFKADRRGIYLSEVQQNVNFVIAKIYQKLSKDWDNQDLYKKYIDAELLYCRVSIAMYEDLITMADEFCSKNGKEYWMSVFQNRIDYLAIKMYQLTVFQDDGISKCCPMDLSAYNAPLVVVIPKDDTYILPESNTRIHDISEIQALTEEELELARNEIFARHGRKFKREDLQEYFEGKSWYDGTIEPADFDDNTMLSDIEKANLELIRDIEEGTTFFPEKAYEEIISWYASEVKKYEEINSDASIDGCGPSLTEGFGYAYYDINQDGIEELLIGRKFSEEPDAYGYTFDVSGFDIYQYIDGEIHYLYESQFDRGGLLTNDTYVWLEKPLFAVYITIFKDGTLKYESIDDNYQQIYYKISETEVEKIGHLCLDYEGSYTSYDFSEMSVGYEREKEISESEYYKLKNHYEKSGEIQLDWNLINLDTVQILDELPVEDWQQAYAQWFDNYLNELNIRDGYYPTSYCAYVDDNDIPEIICHGDCEATGSALLYYNANGTITLDSLGRLGCDYIERTGLVKHSSGHFGIDDDCIYQLNNGELVQIAYGEKDRTFENSDDYLYYWNNLQVSEDEYSANMKSVFDTSQITNPGTYSINLYSMEELISKWHYIKEYNIVF